MKSTTRKSKMPAGDLSPKAGRRQKERAKKGSKVVARATSADGAIRVDIKEREDGRGWRYYAEYSHPSKGRRRPSLQTDDLEEAKRNAQDIADQLALVTGRGSVEDLARISQYGVTLGQVLDEYRQKRLPNFLVNGVPNGHWINMDRVIRVAEAAWGRETVVCEIGETEVESFKVRRRMGGIEIAARVLPDQFDRLVLAPEPVVLDPCESPRTIRGELALLSIIFNWATRHKVKGGRGRTLIAANPLKGIPFAAGVEEPKRPVMTEPRYQVMLKYAPEVEAITRGELGYQRHFADGRVVISRNPRGRRGRRFTKMPKGFLVTLLMVARGTWRRIDAIRGLRVRDLLLTRDQVRRKLLELAWPEDWADHWPYGAIFWDPAYDKEGYSRVTPISKRLHDQLVAYLREIGTIDPTAWLFPSPSKPGQRAGNGQVWRWFRRIERVAKYNGEDLLPLKWGAFHTFRRQGRSERAGFMDDKLIALVGGWQRFQDAAEAMNQGYLQYHPRALYLCAEYDPERDAPRDGRIPGVHIVVQAPDVAPVSAAQTAGEAGSIVALDSPTRVRPRVVALREPLAQKGL